MKEPYELRVIADALERWTEGPAVNAMKYAMTTLREIADEIDAANASLRQGQTAVEQEPIPSSPVAAVALPAEPPTPAVPPVNPTPAAEASPATSISEPVASSHDLATGASVSSENPTQTSEPATGTSSESPSPVPSTPAA